MNLAWIFLLLSACLFCCGGSRFPDKREFVVRNATFGGKIVFQPLQTTTGFKVLLQDDSAALLDQTIFKYEPYRFDTADVNHDGRTDIIIGLIKMTRFDPLKKKRLFILQIDNHHVRPLWLGSKVCQELIDFRALSNGYIQTLERNKSEGYDIGRYYWQGFGLALDKYTHHEKSITHATQTFSK